MDITLRVDMAALRIGFKKAGADEFSRQNRKLLWFLEALTRCNVLWLETNPQAPMLYDSGVRYRPEKSTEAWLDIPHILKARFGDCEDLASWRVAELRVRGVKAKPFLKWYNRPQGQNITLYHVQVRYPDGRIEDPSKELGMKGRA